MTKDKRLTGVFTALVTPMRNGKVAFDELTALVERQIEGGVDGLIPTGTTGESPTLNPKEQIEIIRAVVEAARGRVPVIAGTGANATDEAIHLTREADAAGADGFLQVTPYYNKPSQEGLFRHFAAVAEVTSKPIILYSIPGRCVIEIAPETFKRLYAAYPHVNAIKESGGRVFRASQIIDAAGRDVTILSGEDEHTLPYISVGAHGVISVASNVAPELVVKMVHAALKGDLAMATETHIQLYPLFRDIFIEPSPAPIKYAMKQAGIISSEEVRLPLVELSPDGRKKLDSTLKNYQL